MKERKYQVCTRCVMDTTDSKIVFDENGICDHCRNFDSNIFPKWQRLQNNPEELTKLVDKIKKHGKNKKYDCIIGLSGGLDSTYLLYYAVEVLGLRPMVFTVDTGWNLPVADKNINNIVNKLGLKLYKYEINKEEMMDLQLSFFKSQVAYQDIPQDHVIFAALYKTAVKNKIKYVLTGANYSMECVREPNEWVYQNDLKMIKDIHKKNGRIKLRTLPLVSMFKYKIIYRYFKGMKVISPLNYIDYTKKDVIKLLREKFDYEPYENKHYESRFTRYYEGSWLIEKFGYDKRKAHFSSLILTKQLTRENALEIISKPPYSEELIEEDLNVITEKLGISKEEFLNIMSKDNKTYKDYKNSSRKISWAIKLAKFIGMEKRNFR